MLKILFPCIAVIGLFLLIRSVLKLARTYTQDQQEFPATVARSPLVLKQAGSYEIDVKRPSVTGVISFRSVFTVTSDQDGAAVPVVRATNVLAGRRDMSGARVVPVAHFTVTAPGSYTFENLSTGDFTPNDYLIVMPSAGLKGALAILLTVCSALLFAGGIVLTMLVFKGKI